MARATGKRTPAQRLIEEMSRGRIAVDAAIDSLLEAAQDGLPDATLDHDRRRRLGHPDRQPQGRRTGAAGQPGRA